MKVSQEARDAAADMVRRLTSYSGSGIRDGECDDHHAVQAFAAFEQSIRDKALEDTGIWEPIETAPKDGSTIYVWGRLSYWPDGPTYTIDYDAYAVGWCNETPQGWKATSSQVDGYVAHPEYWRPCFAPPGTSGR